MMDLNAANQSSQNTGDVNNENEKLEIEPASNRVPEEISDKIVSENIANVEEPASNDALEEKLDKIDSERRADGERTPASHRQQNDYFEKETESCAVIKNISKSSTAFRLLTVVDTDKTTSLNDASIIERSPTSYTSGNLLLNTSEPSHHAVKETDEMDVRKSKINPTPTLATMEASTSGSTIIPNCEKGPQISNAGFQKHDMHCDVLKDDDDCDIYQPGFEIRRTESLHESLFNFESPMIKNTESLAKGEFRSSADNDSCQSASPNAERGKRCSPFNNFVNNGGTVTERNVQRMLMEVKEFFLNHPVHVTNDLSYLESKMFILTDSYFSKDFALKHGLPLPAVPPFLQLDLRKNPAILKRLFTGISEVQNLGISEVNFFSYIYLDNQRSFHSSPWSLYKDSGLKESTIWRLDRIQERVGTDIFNMIHEQLRTDEHFLPLLRDKELLASASLYWNTYAEHIELLEKQPTLIEYNEADSTFAVAPEDIWLSHRNKEFSSHILETAGLNVSNSNSYADSWISDGVGFETNTDFQSINSRLRDIKTPGPDDPDANSCSKDRTSEDSFHSRTNTNFQSTNSRLHSIESIGLNDPDGNSYANNWISDGIVSETNTDFQNTNRRLDDIETPGPNDPDANSYDEDKASEDIFDFRANTDFQSTRSQLHGIETIGLNDPNANSHDKDRTSEDILDSRANTDFQNTNSRLPDIKTPDQNNRDTNSYVDDGQVDDIPEVQSVNTIDFQEMQLKCSPTMQSANRHSNENPSPIDLFPELSDKSNKSLDPDSFMLSHIQNSFHENGEETPRKVDLEASITSSKSAMHSFNQTFKGKLIVEQSENSFEVSENVSKALPRVRKYISRDDDAKARKKIRLEENSNIDQPGVNKEKR